MPNTENMECKVIRKARIARQLLACDNKIVDIKADSTDPDHKRSVFVFLSDEKFKEDLDRIMKENEVAKTATSKADMDALIEKEVQRRVDAAIEERFKKIEKYAEV